MELNYLQPFFDFAWKYISPKEETKRLIVKYADHQMVPKGEILLNEGKVCSNLYFSTKGYARSYHYYKEKEITYWVYPERAFFTSWSSFLKQAPSFESIIALEDIELIVFRYEDLQEMFLESSDFERLFRLILEGYVSSMEEFYKSYAFLSAKEKYQLLLSYMPELDQRVNLGYIASMLGISQETLSRVRSS